MEGKIKQRINSVKDQLKEIELEGGWVVEALQNELKRLEKKEERIEKRIKRDDS